MSYFWSNIRYYFDLDFLPEFCFIARYVGPGSNELNSQNGVKYFLKEHYLSMYYNTFFSIFVLLYFSWIFQSFSWKQRLKLTKTFHQKLFQPLDWGSCCIPIAASASADRERNPLSQSYSWKFCPSTKENCNFCIIRGTRFGAPQLVGLHVSKRLTGILLAMKRTYLGQSKWNTCHGPRKYTTYPSTSSLCT